VKRIRKRVNEEMRRIVAALFLSVSIVASNFAEENQQNNDVSVYTFFINIANEQFRFPLIGFINIALGDYNLPQIGFVNWNKNNFETLQLGFVNTVGGDMTGLQIGFVNTTFGENTDGLQLGFINTTVNKFSGSQISFVNITRKLNGLQLGFINYTDSIEEGMPIGFLSIVRDGGYKAIELGASETSPFNLAFKIGVEKFYTSFGAAYNPFSDGVQEQIILDAGFGTILHIGETFFFNPEIISHVSINEKFQNYISFVPYFGYKFMPNLSIVAGPSVLWIYPNSDDEVQEPFMNILKYEVNEKSKLFFGGRISLRFQL
jgi:hypothetical protein